MTHMKTTVYDTHEKALSLEDLLRCGKIAGTSVGTMLC